MVHRHRGEKFVKDVMETQSCEYGFILYLTNCRYYGSKEVTGLISVSCMMGTCIMIFLWLFLFVVTRKRRAQIGKNKPCVVPFLFLVCIWLLRCNCGRNAVINNVVLFVG